MVQIIIENLHVKQEYCKDVFSLSQVGVCTSVLLVTLLVSSTELDAERTSPTALG